MSTSTNSSIHSIDKLDGTNYHAWKYKIQMVLIDKDLWEVVDETEKKPENDNNGAAAWTKKDKKALATISLTIKDSELVHVRPCKSSSEAWKKLAEVTKRKAWHVVF